MLWRRWNIVKLDLLCSEAGNWTWQMLIVIEMNEARLSATYHGTSPSTRETAISRHVDNKISCRVLLSKINRVRSEGLYFMALDKCWLVIALFIDFYQASWTSRWFDWFDHLSWNINLCCFKCVFRNDIIKFYWYTDYYPLLHPWSMN